jgi:hypothetical protein
MTAPAVIQQVAKSYPTLSRTTATPQYFRDKEI